MIKPVTSFALAAACALAALSLPAQAADAPVAPAPDLAKGQASFAGVCAACHNADGNSLIEANPRLAGQIPEYLFKQTQQFRNGERVNATMNSMIVAVTEDDARNIAYWLAAQKPAQVSVSAQPADIALGEKIWRGGLASRQVPACASCHAPNGAGMPAQYPRLAGQFASYVEAQMKAFRDGQRTNDKVMPGVVAGMNDAQIKAVAEFVQGLR